LAALLATFAGVGAVIAATPPERATSYRAPSASELPPIHAATKALPLAGASAITATSAAPAGSEINLHVEHGSGGGVKPSLERRGLDQDGSPIRLVASSAHEQLIVMRALPPATPRVPQSMPLGRTAAIE
jgi:hypothetical protein